MAKILDANGLSCPEPVLMTRDAVEAGGFEELEVMVDNDGAKENVSRFLESQNFSVSVFSKDAGYRIVAHPGEDSPGEESRTGVIEPLVACGERQKIMVLASTDRMGFGDDGLGKKLMVSFIKTIKEMGEDLWRLVFVNNGVKLTVEESPVIEDLLAYEEQGLHILVCGTCLDHFGLVEAKKAGETTNMLDIVTAMQMADKVIKI